MRFPELAARARQRADAQERLRGAGLEKTAPGSSCGGSVFAVAASRAAPAEVQVEPGDAPAVRAAAVVRTSAASLGGFRARDARLANRARDLGEVPLERRHPQAPVVRRTAVRRHRAREVQVRLRRARPGLLGERPGPPRARVLLTLLRTLRTLMMALCTLRRSLTRVTRGGRVREAQVSSVGRPAAHRRRGGRREAEPALTALAAASPARALSARRRVVASQRLRLVVVGIVVVLGEREGEVPDGVEPGVAFRGRAADGGEQNRRRAREVRLAEPPGRKRGEPRDELDDRAPNHAVAALVQAQDRLRHLLVSTQHELARVPKHLPEREQRPVRVLHARVRLRARVRRTRDGARDVAGRRSRRALPPGLAPGEK